MPRTGYDDFAAVDGTLINGRVSPSGHVWGDVAGVPTINGGQMTGATNGCNARLAGAGLVNGYAKMRWDPGDDSVSRGASIRIRYSSNNDFLFVKVRRSTTPVCQTQLWRRVGGVTDGAALFTTTHASNFFAADTPVEVMAVWTGEKIRAFINGVQVDNGAWLSSFNLGAPGASEICFCFEETIHASQGIDNVEFGRLGSQSSSGLILMRS